MFEREPCNGNGGAVELFHDPPLARTTFMVQFNVFVWEEDDFFHEKNLERENDIGPQGTQHNLVQCDLFIWLGEFPHLHWKMTTTFHSNNFACVMSQVSG